MTLLHRFATPVQVIMTLALYVELAIVVAIAATPGGWGALWVWHQVAARPLPEVVQVFILCLLGALAYFSYTIVVIFVVPLLRITTPGTPEGRFPFYSWKAFRWASYNALILLVRFTCINFLRVTPLLPLFHRMMGMRIGKRVQINTAVIGDSNLIEIGDDTVIGGDVTLVAHSAERGEFVTERVVIGRRVTVGLMCVIPPGCRIGDGAILAANAVLAKGTQVGEGEVWGGVPARRLSGGRAELG
jgi:acetyltransferase-like isoleucine patch superfamily enzyme